MGFGITTAISSLNAKEIELQTISNNIANIQTNGFKEVGVSFEATLDKNVSNPEISDFSHAVVKQNTSYLNFSQGSVARTDNPLDMAIQGDGFFEVQTNEGIRYTRDGSFSLNNEGTLINARGDTILTDNGPINIPQGTVIHVGKNGEISANDEIIGKLKITDFTDKWKMQPIGKNYYSAEGLTPNENLDTAVLQGHIEGSNVNLVNNITKMIQVSRAYESLQKSIKQQVSASKLLNRLAQIG
ncbi:flagellar basal-body rod protein FlgF [bacterium K02(2017)]|nr:flagellar basal-body rod protein FlgF [bacterium K02(2017)]